MRYPQKWNVTHTLTHTHTPTTTPWCMASSVGTEDCGRSPGARRSATPGPTNARVRVVLSFQETVVCVCCGGVHRRFLGREQHWFSPKAVSGGDLDIQQTMHSQVHCRNESAVVVIDRKDRAQLSQTASITRAQRSSSSSVPLTLLTVQRI